MIYENKKRKCFKFDRNKGTIKLGKRLTSCIKSTREVAKKDKKEEVIVGTILDNRVLIIPFINELESEEIAEKSIKYSNGIKEGDNIITFNMAFKEGETVQYKDIPVNTYFYYNSYIFYKKKQGLSAVARELNSQATFTSVIRNEDSCCDSDERRSPRSVGCVKLINLADE